MELIKSWRRQAPSLRVLRAFLGVTFAYAGVQKLADPGYLSSSSPTFIGTQLREFAIGSPMAWLLHPLMQHSIGVGVAVALVEIAIGVGTLVGIAPFIMALGGCLTSLVLWLSATWHVHPYFLGSDSIYAVTWAAYAISLRETRGSPSAEAAPDKAAPLQPGIDRRTFIRSGAFISAVLALGGMARGLRGTSKSTGLVKGTAAAPAPSSSAPTSHAPSPRSVDGNPIIAADKLKVGHPVAFTGPSGEPAVLFRLADDEVVAYSRVCTHAGCTVGYDSSSDLLVCPCHSAQFDPSQGGRVLSGPTSIPLPEIAVAVDDASGEVVAT
ncbi:MAG: thiosulfate dehydrogenase (quinone) large subunit [Actinomycetota bacterium]|jgi:Rieske Fe-S protein/uncharacterized membrane protein YphA (DoxX/SURF4 family)|nr:thiosulfate dehydrogenase (quinone) large subunit [Actinomycetota bacterium]